MAKLRARQSEAKSARGWVGSTVAARVLRSARELASRRATESVRSTAKNSARTTVASRATESAQNLEGCSVQTTAKSRVTESAQNLEGCSVRTTAKSRVTESALNLEGCSVRTSAASRATESAQNLEACLARVWEAKMLLDVGFRSAQDSAEALGAQTHRQRRHKSDPKMVPSSLGSDRQPCEQTHAHKGGGPATQSNFVVM